VLVGQGLLDRAKLEEALSGDRPQVDTDRIQMVDFMSAEAWAQGWIAQGTADTRRMAAVP